MARAEMMKHVQDLIEQEFVRHQAAWDELAKLAGFENVQGLRKAGWELSIDWFKCSLTLKDQGK